MLKNRLILEKKSMASGFTLIELLVGITLTILIFLGASSLVIVLFTSSARASQQDEMEQAKNDITQELSNAIRWADSVHPNNESKHIIVKTASKTVVYKLQGERLIKHTDPMTPETIAITALEINDYSASADVVSLKIDIDFEHAEFRTFKDRMTIVISQRNAESTETNL